MLFFGKKSVAETTLKIGYDGKKAETGLKGLKTTIKTVLSAYAIKQVAGYTYQLAKMGATAELVDKSMKKFAVDRGKDYDDMMTKLKTATSGLMTDMELQQQAMQAMIGGVSFNDIITSMEYVSKFAMTTGTDVASKMRTVMTGLARKSAAFLDDVGIQVMGSKDVVKDAMIQMKEKMGQFAVSTDDAIVKTTQLAVATKELTSALGKKLAPTLGYVSKKLAELFTSVKDIISPSKKSKSKALNSEIKSIEKTLIDTNKKIKSLQMKSIMNPFHFINISRLEAEKKHLKKYLKDLVKMEDDALQKDMKTNQQKSYKINYNLQNKTIEKVEKEEKKVKKGKVTTNNNQVKENANNLIALKQLKDSEKKVHKEYQSYVEGIKRIHDQVMLSQDEYAKQNIINNVNDEYAILIEKYQSNDIVLKDIDILKKREIEDRQKAHEDRMTTLHSDGAMSRIEIARTSYNQLSSFMSIFQGFSNAMTNKKIANLEKENLSREEFAKRRDSLIEKSKEKAKEFARFQQTMAIFQAIINTYTAGMQTYAKAPVFTKTIAMALTIAQGMLTVGKIQAQHFSQGSGTIGETQSYRSTDSIHAIIGKGERVISAPDNARNKEVLDAIANNTMSTNLSLKRFGSSSSGNVVNNFYSLTDEQLQRATNNNSRKNIVGEQI